MTRFLKNCDFTLISLIAKEGGINEMNEEWMTEKIEKINMEMCMEEGFFSKSISVISRLLERLEYWFSFC